MSLPTVERALQGLNEQQRAAVLTVDGPLLVVAGAGSGKTRMLTMRIAYLIEHCRVAPTSILAVTFTNKAAREMRERVAHLFPAGAAGAAGAAGVTLTTFHSFCAMLLRRYHQAAGFSTGFSIYDEDDSERIIKQVINHLGLDPKRYSPGFLLHLISQAKNELLTPETFVPDVDDPLTVKNAYAAYQELLSANQAVDFDDLLFTAFTVLERHPQILAHFQERYRYFLVDEYQDTNHAQYRLIALLSGKSGNLCVVGDEDQSIYSWRGATIRNIRDFTTDFPGAKVIMLEQNYRSSQVILDAAGSLIERNTGSYKKKLWTERTGGPLLRFAMGADERAEADGIAREIQRLISNGERLAECAVLFRMNSLSRAIEQALVRSRIPYQLTGGMRFFQRAEVKDFLAYLRVLANPQDSVALKRIINTPRRGIGATTIARLEAEGPLWESVNTVAKQRPDSKIAGFWQQVLDWRSQVNHVSLLTLAKNILRETGLVEHFQRTDPDNAREREENLQSLLADIRLQEDSTDNLTLHDYLATAALHADVDDFDQTTERVHLMTLHNAKGLEFDTVFLLAMEEGIFPHHSAQDTFAELEEERRLAYVGITRARQRLYLSAAQRRMLFGTWNTTLVSRFIGEIERRCFDPAAAPGGAWASLSSRPTGAGGNVTAKPTPWGSGRLQQRSATAAQRFPSLARSGPRAAQTMPAEKATEPAAAASTSSSKVSSSSASPSRAAHGSGAGTDFRTTIARTPAAATATPTPMGAAGTMVNLKRGIRVFHQVFGYGQVTATEGSTVAEFRVTIAFEKVGCKTLLLQYAQLRVI